MSPRSCTCCVTSIGARTPARRRSRSDGSSTSRCSVAVHALTSLGGTSRPSTPSWTTSARAPRREAITGTPATKASCAIKEKASYQSEGTASTSTSARQAQTCSRDNSPMKRTRGPAIDRSSWAYAGSDASLPATHNSASPFTRSNASIRTWIPFCQASPPMYAKRSESVGMHARRRLEADVQYHEAGLRSARQEDRVPHANPSRIGSARSTGQLGQEPDAAGVPGPPGAVPKPGQPAITHPYPARASAQRPQFNQRRGPSQICCP